MRRKKRKKKRGVGYGNGLFGGIFPATVAKPIKAATAKPALEGIGAGFAGAIGGRFISSVIGKRIAPAGASPGTLRTVMNLVTAGTGAIIGAVIGSVVFKSPEAARIAVTSNFVLGLDALAGPKIHEAFGFSMGQLRLPEDATIAGMDQLRLPEDATIGQYDEMDQVIEEEDLMGEDDDERGVF